MKKGRTEIIEHQYINQHLHQWTETYEAVGSNSTLEQNPASVTGGRVPNPPFFLWYFSVLAKDLCCRIVSFQNVKPVLCFSEKIARYGLLWCGIKVILWNRCAKEPNGFRFVPFDFFRLCPRRTRLASSGSSFCVRPLRLAPITGRFAMPVQKPNSSPTLSVTLEEADEPQFWMEVMIESEIMSEQRLAGLMKEAGEITAILTAARSNT